MRDEAARTAVIVGASTAGVAAARALREYGWRGRVILIGGEPHLPYERPPLSKRALQGSWSPDDALLLSREEASGLDIDLRLGTPATGMHPDAMEVTVGAERLGFDTCLIATGITPRTLRATPPRPGLHVLRTTDDAQALRRFVGPSTSLVIIGAGFVGLEVAASARLMGADVTVVESAFVPLQGAVDGDLSERLLRLHRSRGVSFRLGVTVVDVQGQGHVEGVTLSDGTELRTSAVLVAVGSLPNTSWLENSGLELADGVVCDPFCQTSHPAVFVAGDVARTSASPTSQMPRAEHWTNALDQGRAAALNMIHVIRGEPLVPYDRRPYFWTDQFGVKLQFAGDQAPSAEYLTSEDSDRGRLIRVYRGGESITAVACLNWPSQFANWRKRLSGGARWLDVLDDGSFE